MTLDEHRRAVRRRCATRIAASLTAAEVAWSLWAGVEPLDLLSNSAAGTVSSKTLAEARRLQALIPTAQAPAEGEAACQS